MLCSAERHSGLRDNFSFAEVAEQAISGMIRASATTDADAGPVCVQYAAASVVRSLEKELGIPIYDSIAGTVWKSLCWPASMRAGYMTGSAFGDDEFHLDRKTGGARQLA